MTSTLTYQIERIQDIYDELLPILKEHYFEIAHYKDIKFEPNVAEYFKLEDLGFLKTFTARENGELIGYNVFFIKRNMHYKSSLQATNDIIFIRKDRRGFGKNFINWCDDELRKIGVQICYHHIKFSQDWSPMLERIGYEKIDIIMGKRLDKE